MQEAPHTAGVYLVPLGRPRRVLPRCRVPRSFYHTTVRLQTLPRRLAYREGQDAPLYPHPDELARLVNVDATPVRLTPLARRRVVDCVLLSQGSEHQLSACRRAILARIC